MADTQITKIYANAAIQRGSLVYIGERRGLRAKMARFLYKRLKWEKLHEWGYGAMLSNTEAYKHPIGIALNDHTVLIGGTVEWGDGFPQAIDAPLSRDNGDTIPKIIIG